MKTFTRLGRCAKGDQVAVLSPSSGLAGLFPWVQDLGLDRLRAVFGLEPQEYPTTRLMGASPRDRARDVMAAFADPANKAVFTSIGGDDQIKVIRHIDPEVLRANPKPFFGFSDNTHLHNLLWTLGVPSYYGGAIMSQFAMPGGMPELTVESLNRALFTGGSHQLSPAETYSDIDLAWTDRDSLNRQPEFEPNDGFRFDGVGTVEGPLWGGCVESLLLQLTTDVYLPSDDDLDGAVLYLETSESVPEPWLLEYLLTGLGERGWLARFAAVLVGRPKAWAFDKPATAEWKKSYRATQQATVRDVVRAYDATMPLVQNLDFGHTHPQVIVPSGSRAVIDADAWTVTFEY